MESSSSRKVHIRSIDRLWGTPSSFTVSIGRHGLIDRHKIALESVRLPLSVYNVSEPLSFFVNGTPLTVAPGFYTNVGLITQVNSAIQAWSVSGPSVSYIPITLKCVFQSATPFTLQLTPQIAHILGFVPDLRPSSTLHISPGFAFIYNKFAYLYLDLPNYGVAVRATDSNTFKVKGTVDHTFVFPGGNAGELVIYDPEKNHDNLDRIWVGPSNKIDHELDVELRDAEGELLDLKGEWDFVLDVQHVETFNRA